MSATVGLPVLRREMRSRMFDRTAIAIVSGYLLTILAVEAVYLLRGTPASVAGGGAALFDRLVLAQLVLLSVLTPLVVADAVSGERQRGTWDVLVMTSMPLAGIVWGKLVGRLAFLLLLLVIALPIVAISFLFGDLPPRSVLAPYAVLCGSVVCIGALALLISSLTGSLRRAVAAGIVLGVALTFGGAAPIAAAVASWHPLAVPDAGRSMVLPFASALNPLVALDSALPSGSMHVRLFSLDLPIWVAFLPLAAGFSTLCFLGSLLGSGRPTGWSGSR